MSLPEAELVYMARLRNLPG